jgi:hypothetical protein
VHAPPNYVAATNCQLDYRASSACKAFVSQTTFLSRFKHFVHIIGPASDSFAESRPRCSIVSSP